MCFFMLDECIIVNEGLRVKLYPDKVMKDKFNQSLGNARFVWNNLLFFDNTHSTKNIWFYRYDLKDGKKFSLTLNPMTREKFSDIDEWWDNRKEIKDEKIDESLSETWKSRNITLKEIIDNNYSLDYCGFPKKEEIILSPEETINNFIQTREKLEKVLDGKLKEITNLIKEIK